jgi:hypothetical protein
MIELHIVLKLSRPVYIKRTTLSNQIYPSDLLFIVRNLPILFFGLFPGAMSLLKGLRLLFFGFLNFFNHFSYSIYFRFA